MENENAVIAPKVQKEWVRNTWAKKVRAMKVGDELPIGSNNYMKRQNKYTGAKRAFPGATFTVLRNDEGVYVVKRTA